MAANGMSIGHGIDSVDFRPPISIISDQIEIPSVKLGDRDEERGSTESELGEEEPRRIIYLNSPQALKYCSNKVSTAKYKPFTFIPIFLFEQFRKYSNIFFLFMAMLQQIPEVSPTGRYTTLVPLVFILTVSAVKEIIEDYKRHRADRETNHRLVEVLREGAWSEIKWQDIVVGDIIKVKNNKFFPADLVLISSSEPQGICFIETSNLDGETNLKIRQGLQATSELLEANDLLGLSGTLHCEQPNRLLYEFKGVLYLTDFQAMPLGPNQLLLRGAQLRNTTWAFGVVTYTGHETKLMKNATRVPLKRSSVEKMTNTQILILFSLLLLLCLLSAVFSELWTQDHIHTEWYIALDEIENTNFGFNLLTFIILYNNLIPISLQVTIELVRIIQASFINMDLDMYHEETDTPAMARTSNLNEELGMIKYVFSDKTGTLTRNIMEFKKCSIAEKIYTYGDPQLVEDFRQEAENCEYISEFMQLLSICHTVIPEKGEDEITYQAASPDERALVRGARAYGWTFVNRTPDLVEVNILGETKRFKILNVLEFTSSRRRMSVIVQDPKGVIKIYTKGADSVIYERLADFEMYREGTLKHLADFANEGLRTLCCAYAVISKAAYDEWRQIYFKAATNIRHREEKLEEAANLIENNLVLLGATAIEDKLQEKVPETIETLIKADIRVWVLTGDKQETAINIGHSCRLITSDMAIFILNEDSLDGAREAILRQNAELGDSLRRTNDLALIIDGATLTHALSGDVRRDFLDLCVSCRVVICCRVSPSQKADVVELVAKTTKAITLAIGDGANDVAMIQKAHVGVGISGVEGLQAACASDYSIAQFRYLAKLVLVHGAWNYDRMCKLILYSFYKNICLYVVELWFALYSAWSGQILFERWSIGLYNVIFTVAPPLALGLFDRVCTAEARLAYPRLYKPSQTAQYFNFKVFWIWIMNALCHSVILFWFPFMIVSHDVLWENGRVADYLVFGNIVYTYVVVTVSLKAGLTTSSWTWLTHLAISGSIGLWFSFLNLWSNIWPTVDLASVMFGQDIFVFSSASFWFGLFAAVIAPLILDVTFIAIRNTFYKTYTDKVREVGIKKKGMMNMAPDEPIPTALPTAASVQPLSETARLLRSVKSALRPRGNVTTEFELSHGFAFSQEEGGITSQLEVIRAYNTTIPKPTGT